MKKIMLLLMLCSALLFTTANLFGGGPNVLDNVTITPNPMDKFTTVTVTVNQPASIGVNVETENGVVIKTLYWGNITGQIALTWNRVADDGTYTPAGNYVLVVNHQGRYTSTKKTLILK
jgi:hypothetical protein